WPGGLTRGADGIHPLALFHRTWPPDHTQIATANFHTRNIHDARLRMGLATGQLVRRQDRYYILHARNGPQRLRADLFLVADDTDDRAIRAAAQMCLEAQRFDALDHMTDLVVADSGLEDDNHGNLLLFCE